MAADVFRDGLHGDVHAVSESVKQNARRPGVIENHFYVSCVRGRNDGGNILHFHGDRSRTLRPNETGIFLNKIGDASTDTRIVKRGHHAETRKKSGGEFAVWAVNTGWNENMIARLEQREIDQRNGGLASRSKNR